MLCRRPDLLFVEFAVNDYTRPAQDIRDSLEGILSRLWRDFPDCDVVFVLTATGKMRLENPDGLPESVRIHREVAEKYRIPWVDVGRRLLSRVEEGTALEDLLPDGVHPNRQGYRIYFEGVWEFLENILEGRKPGEGLEGGDSFRREACDGEICLGDRAEKAGSAQTEPFFRETGGKEESNSRESCREAGASREENHSEEGSEGVENFQKKTGRTEQSDSEESLAEVESLRMEIGRKEGRYTACTMVPASRARLQGFVMEHIAMCGRYGSYVSSSRPGDFLEFIFRGDKIGLFYMISCDGGRMEWSLDGGDFEELPAWDAYARSFDRGSARMLAEDLEAGEHRLCIRVAAGREEESRGNFIRISDFLV